MGKYILEANNIRKEFPGVVALDDVNFNLKEGEVHALLGENGAGKSTMMKIFSGVHRKTSGTLKINGEVIELESPIHAASLGIGIIYQELNLCPHLTVAENIFLSREFCKGLRVDIGEQEKEAQKILDTLQSDIRPNEKVKNLSISQQQIVEIAKALSQDANMIIMDEPTSSLSEREIEKLFEIVNSLKKQGKGIIYISHKLDELQYIADRVTVFRDGKYIVSDDYENMTINGIIASMVGREITEQFPKVDPIETDEKVLEVKSITNKYVDDISFELYKGEVLGISGLVGAGRTELCKTIFGAYGKCEGEVYIAGDLLDIKTPESTINQGLAYVPEDRKGEGLAINMKISQNFSFPILDKISSKILGIVSQEKLMTTSKELGGKLKLKTPNYIQKVKNLSGGNQQKVVIGKWIANNPKVIIFDEPTRGIDVSAKVEIYKIINELKENGIGVILVSSELPEILGVTDRILVMCDGKLKKTLITDDTNQKEIMHYATQF